MMSQRTFTMSNIAKNFDSLSSSDPISGVYILQEWNHFWATIYVNYIYRLHGGQLFSVSHCVFYSWPDIWEAGFVVCMLSLALNK